MMDCLISRQGHAVRLDLEMTVGLARSDASMWKVAVQPCSPFHAQFTMMVGTLLWAFHMPTQALVGLRGCYEAHTWRRGCIVTGHIAGHEAMACVSTMSGTSYATQLKDWRPRQSYMVSATRPVSIKTVNMMA